MKEEGRGILAQFGGCVARESWPEGGESLRLCPR